MTSILRFGKFFSAIAISLIFLSLSFSYSTKKYKVFNTLRLTAIECIDLDANFARFALCKLKPINRTLKVLNIRVILYQTPVTNSTVSFKVLKRANGYKPFGIDVYLDICKYFAGKKNPVFDWFYNIWLPYTNINHTCPYLSDMIVSDLPTTDIRLPSVFPGGLYRIDLKVLAYNVPRALVKIYLEIDEKDFY